MHNNNNLDKLLQSFIINLNKYYLIVSWETNLRKNMGQKYQEQTIKELMLK